MRMASMRKRGSVILEGIESLTRSLRRPARASCHSARARSHGVVLLRRGRLQAASTRLASASMPCSFAIAMYRTARFGEASAASDPLLRCPDPPSARL